MSPAHAASSSSAAPAQRWICPFCPLLCEHLGVSPPPESGSRAAPLQLLGGDCARARQRLGRLLDAPTDASTDAQAPSKPPSAAIDGQPCSLEAALQRAADLLQASAQPLFGGLGTDVAGARALYRLACATGAISDSAQGPALTQGQRALQDRGGFSTTLAELRTRADLVLCLGGVFAELAPLFIERCVLPARSAGIEGTPPPRQVVILGQSDGDHPAEAAVLAQLAAAPGITLQRLLLQGDWHDTLALLAALVAQRALPAAPPALQALAQALRAAQYGVIVGATSLLPAQGALVVEAVHRIVEQLNGQTRAAALWLGGGEGAATVNQVYTWLSGLPLRSRSGPVGLEHEPVCFDARRLLDDRAVDLLLWVSSFDADALPPPAACPRIVLGPPALGVALGAALAASAAGPTTVFIPVATPGIDVAGDLFRTDGTVLLPLVALPQRAGLGLLPLAEMLRRMGALLPGGAAS